MTIGMMAMTKSALVFAESSPTFTRGSHDRSVSTTCARIFDWAIRSSKLLWVAPGESRLMISRMTRISRPFSNAGVPKLSRSLRSVAHVIAAIDTAAAGPWARSVKAVREDLVGGRRVDVDRVEEESGEVRRGIRREAPADHDRLAGVRVSAVVNGLNTAVAVPLPGSAFELAVVTPLYAPCDAG